jgi:hypothetical protein
MCAYHPPSEPTMFLKVQLQNIYFLIPDKCNSKLKIRRAFLSHLKQITQIPQYYLHYNFNLPKSCPIQVENFDKVTRIPN